jgi:hypothetical protein
VQGPAACSAPVTRDQHLEPCRPPALCPAVGRLRRGSVRAHRVGAKRVAESPGCRVAKQLRTVRLCERSDIAGPRRAAGLVVRLCLPASRALAQPRPRSSPSHLRRLACCSAGYRRAQAKATVNGARSVEERASTIRVPTHRRARSAPDAAAARHRNGAINVERLPPSASAMASLERRPQPLSQSARGTSTSRRARRAYS